MRSAPALGLCLTLAATVVLAQDSDPGAAPDSTDQHSGAPVKQFTIGPVVVTPTFRIGSLAVDTNVLYRRERRVDFLASAGPGLDIALPFKDHWKLDVRGSSQYFYFVRTKELRRWTGGGSTTLFWATTGTRASVSTGLNRDFSRPSFEVDARVASRQRRFSGAFERDLGRLTLVARAAFARNTVDLGQEFRGVDLAAALTTDRYTLSPEFRYHLTPLSSILIEGTYEESRFPNAVGRNFHTGSAGAGLKTDGLFKGQVTAGFRRNRLNGRTGVASSQPYLRGNLSQRVGTRVRLTETYSHESAISAFAVDGSLPTFERRGLSLGLGIDVTRRIDFRLRGTQEKVKSDGLVKVLLDDGTVGAALRDDTAYIAEGDLGMRLGRARVAVFTSYTTRKSLYFSDFGIDGLQAGARVEYAPR